jgi:hypothetical protein
LNGDWGVFFYNPERLQPEGGPYSAQAIHRYVDLLADSGVDTFLVSPNTQVPWYPSKVLPTALDGYTRGDHAFVRRQKGFLGGDDVERSVSFLNRYLDLREAGVDWLAEAAAACRRRGIAPWLSIRMNDMHGSPGSYMNSAALSDPRFHLSGRAINPSQEPNRYWTALNYECPEVRDYMFALIREALVEYDYEGLELDWLRNPNCCEPVASQAVVDTMTEWVAALRVIAERKAQRAGQPIPLGLRVPANLELMRAIGLDVRALARAGLIDFVAPSNFMQSPWALPLDRVRAELGESVAVYGVSEYALNFAFGYSPRLGLSGMRCTGAHPAALRGLAAGQLALGADGIEQYNLFAVDEARTWDGIPDIWPQYEALRDITSLGALRGQPKHYALSTLSPSWSHVPFGLPEPLPALIDPGGRRAFTLAMCAEPADAPLDLTAQVVVEERETARDVGISFNGSWPSFERRATGELLFANGPFTHHVPGHRAYDFVLPIALAREGWNEVVVYNGNQREDGAVRVVSLELAVRRL